MINLELSEIEFEELIRLFDDYDNSFNLSVDLALLHRRMYDFRYRRANIDTIVPDEIPAAAEIISNQGRVRSDNIPIKTCDGLRFRSDTEILLYKALKASGVPFFPLPVCIRGGEDYKRIEPDFVVLKDGVVLIVEIDGDSHKETPAEAHERIRMLSYEGAYVERIKASECGTTEKASDCVKHLMQTIEKLKGLR